MSVFALFSLLASMMAVFLGNFVLYRNPRNALNRVFFVFCLSAASASFAEFGYRQAESFATANFWLRAGFLWTFIMPLELHFVLLFSEKTKVLESKLTYFLLYGPALTLSLSHLFNLFRTEPVKAYWGWTYSQPENPAVDSLLGIWSVGIALVSFYLCLQYYLKATEPKKKRQSWYIFLGLLASLAIASTTELVSPQLRIRVPEFTSTGVALGCIFTAYAMWKYELFALTPATAAESILSTMADALLLVSPGGTIGSVNQAALELLGCEESELIGQPIETIFTPEEKARFKGTWLEQLVTAGSISDTEVIFKTKDVGEIPISLSGSVMRDEDGTERGIVYVGRDLTERKKAEEQIKASLREKEVLLKEIHHRVKNNLQVISSLLYLQSKNIKDRQTFEMFQESQYRVRSMVLVHERLYQSPDLAKVDFAEYVRSLANYLFRSYGVNTNVIQLRTSVDDVLLGIDTAITCGLILNELISNSLKHAFPDGRPGEVRIELRADDDQLTLMISDNGVGFPGDLDFRDTQSLGLQLVNTLVEQIEGTIELDRSGGTAFEIRFAALEQVGDRLPMASEAAEEGPCRTQNEI
jgi:PAS domain S-box-containing protein